MVLSREVVQFFMGLSITVASSRQMWAFSRDGALPFSSCKSCCRMFQLAEVATDAVLVFRPISKRFGHIPLRTIWGCKFYRAE